MMKKKHVKQQKRIGTFMDNNDLIIVLGGGFIVLLAAIVYFNRMQYDAFINKYVKAAMNAEANAPEKVTEYIVEMTDTGLSDPQITIPKESAIRFINRTDMPYTLVASDQSFETKTLQQGESDLVIFANPGTVSYMVKEEPTTKGTVKVLE